MMDGRWPRKWLEIFRGALKSTLGNCWDVWNVVRSPEEEHRLIMSAVHNLSKSFLRDIKRIVLSRPFKAVFPEIQPVKSLWNISEAAVAVAGKERGVREPTWGTGGLDVGMTGTHWSSIRWDDLVIDKNAETKEMREWVRSRFLSFRPLVDNFDTPELMCSTPYPQYDLSAWMKATMPNWFVRLSIPARDPKTADLAWPEEFSHERLDQLKALDPETYWAQYMLDPQPAEMRVFKSEEFRYFRRPEEPEPSGLSSLPSELRPVVKPLQELSLYLGWDPSAGTVGGDEAAFAIVGVDTFGNYYIVDVVHGQFLLQDQMDIFFQLHEMYEPYGGIQRAAVEMAGPFAALNGSLSAEMERRGQYHYIEKAEIRNQNKVARVRLVLGPKYQAHRIYHHWALRNGPIEEQLVGFPGVRHDDICDSISHAIDIAQKYGGYGGVPQQAAVAQARSSFGMHKRIGYTLEELQQLCPEEDPLEMMGRGVSVGLIG